MDIIRKIGKKNLYIILIFITIIASILMVGDILSQENIFNKFTNLNTSIEEEYETFTYEYNLARGEASLIAYEGNKSEVNLEEINSYNDIEYKVTVIEGYTFTSNSIIEVINFSSNITTINSSAFLGMTKLREVNFPDDTNLTTINRYAFVTCTALTTIEIPNSVEYIGLSIFEGCTSLDSIYLNSKIEYLSNQSFNYNDDKIFDVILPNKEYYDWYCDVNNKSNISYITYEIEITLDNNKIVGDENETIILTRLNNRTLNHIKNENNTWITDDDFQLEDPVKDGFIFLYYANEEIQLTNDTILNEENNYFKAVYQGFYDVEYTEAGYIITGINENFKDKLTDVLVIPEYFNDGNNGEADVIAIANGAFAELSNDVKFVYLRENLDYGSDLFTSVSSDTLIIANNYEVYSDVTNKISGGTLTYILTVSLDSNNNDDNIELERLFNKTINYIRNEDNTWSINDFSLPNPKKENFIFIQFNDKNNIKLDDDYILIEENYFTALYQGFYDVELIDEGYVIIGVNANFVSELTNVLVIPTTYDDGNNGELNVLALGKDSFSYLSDIVKYVYLPDIEYGNNLFSNVSKDTLIIAENYNMYDNLVSKVSGGTLTYNLTVKLDYNNKNDIIELNRLYNTQMNYIQNYDLSWSIDVDFELYTPSKENFIFVNYINSDLEILYFNYILTHNVDFKAIYQGFYDVEYTEDGYILLGINENFINELTNVLEIPSVYDDGNNGELNVVALANNSFSNLEVDFIYLIDIVYGSGLFAKVSSDTIIIANNYEIYSDVNNKILGGTVTYVLTVSLDSNNNDDNIELERLFNKTINYVRNEDNTWSINDFSLPTPKKENFIFLQFNDGNNIELNDDYIITKENYFTALYQGFYDVEYTKEGYILLGVNEYFINELTNVLVIPTTYDDGNNGELNVLALGNDSFSYLSDIVKYVYLPDIEYSNNLFNTISEEVLIIVENNNIYNDLINKISGGFLTYEIIVKIQNDNDILEVEALYNKTINYRKENGLWELDSNYELHISSKENFIFVNYINSDLEILDLNYILSDNAYFKAVYQGFYDVEYTDDGYILLGVNDNFINELTNVLVIPTTYDDGNNGELNVIALGDNSFENLDVEFIYLTNIEYGENLFANVDAIVIAPNEVVYEDIKNNVNNVDLTYLISVRINFNNGQEVLYLDRLYNKQINYIENEDFTWSINEEFSIVIYEKEGFNFIGYIDQYDNKLTNDLLLNDGRIFIATYEEIIVVLPEDKIDFNIDTITIVYITLILGNIALFIFIINIRKKKNKLYSSLLPLLALSPKIIGIIVLICLLIVQLVYLTLLLFKSEKSDIVKATLNRSSDNDVINVYSEYENIIVSEERPLILQADDIVVLREEKLISLKEIKEVNNDVLLEDKNPNKLSTIKEMHYPVNANQVSKTSTLTRVNQEIEAISSQKKETTEEELLRNIKEVNQKFLNLHKISSIDADVIKCINFSNDVLINTLHGIKTKNQRGKIDIVNLDIISKNYKNNEVVSIKTLRDKKIISKNIGSVKCLAKGTLDKQLVFELQQYSRDAMKMILITGGIIK